MQYFNWLIAIQSKMSIACGHDIFYLKLHLSSLVEIMFLGLSYRPVNTFPEFLSFQRTSSVNLQSWITSLLPEHLSSFLQCQKWTWNLLKSTNLYINVRRLFPTPLKPILFTDFVLLTNSYPWNTNKLRGSSMRCHFSSQWSVFRQDFSATCVYFPTANTFR